MNILVEDYLHRDGPSRGVREDWEVQTAPDGLVVSVWTHDRFIHADQATRAAERVLRDILDLGYCLSGPCEVDAHRDEDGDWRGHLMAHVGHPA